MKKRKKSISLVLVLSLLLTLFTNSTIFAEGNEETVFYLVRHGKTIMNTLDLVQGWSDSVLTDIGVEGAEDTAYGLKDVKFEVAYSSDRGRTIETANAILNQNEVSGNLNLVQLKEFRETNYGLGEGRPNGEMWGMLVGTFQKENPDTKFVLSDLLDTGAKIVGGGFEKGSELNQRVMRGLKQVSDTSKGGNVLVVAHGNVIQSILENIGYEGDNHVDNSSVTKILYKNGNYSILSVNDLTYMEAGKEKRVANGGVLVEKEDIAEIKSYEGNTTKTSVYLVPHTTTFFDSVDRIEGWADSILTEDGELDAVSLGLGLKDVDFDRAYTSDLGRNIFTTNIIVAQNNTPISITQLKGLREQNFGKYEAGPKANFENVVKELADNADYNNLNVSEKKSTNDILAKNDETNSFETALKFDERVSANFKNIVNELAYNGGGNILVVTDSNVISNILSIIGNDKTNVSNGVTVLTFENEKFTVNTVDDKTYLTNGKNENPFSKIIDEVVFTDIAPKVSLNNETITFSSQPVITKDTTLYPIRELVEKLGGKVYWNSSTKEVVTVLGNKNISYNTGTNKYYENGNVKFMDNGYGVFYKNGISYAPLEYIVTPLSVNLDFDASNGFYKINK